MKSRIPEYIPRLLKEHGNTVISRNLIKKLGINNILEILKQEGFDVEVHTLLEQEDIQFCPSKIYLEKKKGKDVTYLLELKNHHVGESL